MNDLSCVLVGAVLVAWSTIALITRNPHRRKTRFALIASRIAAGLGVVTAGSVVLAVVQHGAFVVPLWEVGGWGASLRFDALSVTMLGLVSVVGWAVVRFSARYLDGDPRHAVFMGRLGLVLAAVSLLVLAGNLLHLVLAWVATGLALQQLLRIDPERPRALAAARKAFVVARARDVCLVVVVVALGSAVSTGDIGALAEFARRWADHGTAPPSMHLAAFALVLAACLGSAQLPVHGWLVGVVETPTPVSVVLHAVVANAGVLSLLRLADVVVLSASAMTTVVVIGGVTAILGSLVMLTQTRVKHALSYSTVAHMGFMLLECGLGAYSAALLHLVGHSLYKAHAFLGSGGMAQAGGVYSVGPRSFPGWARLVVATLVAAAVFAAVGWSMGFDPALQPGFFVLGGVIVMTMTAWLVQAVHPCIDVARLGSLLLGLGALAGLYFALQALARTAYGSVVPAVESLPAAPAFAGGLVLLGLVAVAILQWALPRLPDTPRGLAFYMQLRNGLYLDTRVDRWLRTSLFSPAPLPRSSR